MRAANDGEAGSRRRRFPPRNEVALATVNGKVYVIGGSINRVAVPHVE